MWPKTLLHIYFNFQPYGHIIIPSSSKIIFNDPGVDGDSIELDTLGIQVEGAIEAGSTTCRFQGKLTITLHGEFGNWDPNTTDRDLYVGQTDEFLKGFVVEGIVFLFFFQTLF